MDIFSKYNIKAKKSLGQNFLVDKDALISIGNSTTISNSNIVEIGPGYGALTEILIGKKPKSLTLIELDCDMIDIIESRISDGDLDLSGIDFEIINIDVLAYQNDIDTPDYNIIANIPYYITSPIIRHFFYGVHKVPSNMVLLMQDDVADKILLGVDDKKPKNSVISLFSQKKAHISKIIDIKASSFSPAPKVNSSVIKFDSHNKYDDINDDIFLNFIKLSFSQARKKLINNLVTSGYDKQKLVSYFGKNSINIDSRPESLSLENYIDLIKEFS